MKILASPKSAIVLNTLITIPPKNKKLPRSANNAEQLRATNTTHVPINAVTITWGSIEITMSNSGPIE